MNAVVYGPDGATVLERLVANRDGTGVRTIYDDDGNVVSTETVTGLEVETPVVTPDAAIVQLVQALADPDVTLAAVQEVAAELVTQLPDAVQ